jgi:hypothetical protein
MRSLPRALGLATVIAAAMTFGMMTRYFIAAAVVLLLGAVAPWFRRRA